MPTDGLVVDGTSSVDESMLTGDNRRTAEAIGHELGIARVIAEVLPSDKAKIIQDLQNVAKMLAFHHPRWRHRLACNGAPELGSPDHEE